MKEEKLKSLEAEAAKIIKGRKQLEARAFRILNLVELGLIPKPTQRWRGINCPNCHEPLNSGCTKVSVYTHYCSCPCGYEYAYQEDGGG